MHLINSSTLKYPTQANVVLGCGVDLGEVTTMALAHVDQFIERLQSECTTLFKQLEEEEIVCEVFTSSDGEFENLRRVWNYCIDRRPCCIVCPSHIIHVQACVKICSQEKIEMTVRGGGHSIAGNGVADGAVLLHLGKFLNNVIISDDCETVSVDGGALWGDVDNLCTMFGRAVPAGLIAHTGVGGLCLGGGVGYLSRLCGATCSSLIGAVLVTATGDVRRVGASINNPNGVATERVDLQEDGFSDDELLWALRGGGGNFGVVVKFVFQTHVVGWGERCTVHVQRFYLSPKHASEVLDLYRSIAESNDLPDCSACYLFVCETINMIIVVTLQKDHVESIRQMCEPLRKSEHLFSFVEGEMPLAELNSMHDHGNRSGKHYYWSRSSFIYESPSSDYALSDALIESIAASRQKMVLDSSTIELTRLGGEFSRQTNSSFSQRDAVYEIHGASSWVGEDQNTFERVQKWSRALSRSLGAKSGYLNISSASSDDDSQAIVGSAYGTALPQLREIKQKMDPCNFFHHNHNVLPEEASDVVYRTL